MLARKKRKICIAIFGKKFFSFGYISSEIHVIIDTQRFCGIFKLIEEGSIPHDSEMYREPFVNKNFHCFQDNIKTFFFFNPGNTYEIHRISHNAMRPRISLNFA